VHAEQSAISAAYMHAEKGIEAIAVTAAPCGHCRQFMNEISPHSKIDVLVKDKGATTLAALLPESFGPGDLGRKDGAFPVATTTLAISGKPEAVTTAALEATQMSYAPYSKSPSGVAIATNSGRTFKGSYIENAAFNPSLPPLETALVALIAGGEDFAAITHVTLCEVEGSMISQKSVTEAVLAVIAPRIPLQRVRATRA
jgi:cytidine deaminase